MEKTVNLITGEQYRKGECTSQEFYKQFITSHVKNWVKANYTRENLIKCYKGDTHLNNLGANWLKKMDATWGHLGNTRLVKEVEGYGLTRATNVCIIKAYMREWILDKNA